MALRATLESLRADSESGARLLLLGDGPDAPTAQLLAHLSHLPQSNTPDARGAAACFNRLVASTEADVYVLLESGAVVGPGWLGLLLAALAADRRNGLAGPSTNRSWNEQGLAGTGGLGSPLEVAEAARRVAARFGTEARTLAPLYSLADFCYAVRREVVKSLGAADEGYGLGPCWEMDYNARAERAGFRGVWACGAYVWRAPVGARRRREEASRFDASKRRYQDKFCGARLRGEKTSYRQHCRGDECPNFAPPALIEIRRPPAREEDEGQAVRTPSPAVEGPAPVVETSTPAGLPLVTCIMPTADRRAFVPQALDYFGRQDYPNLELLILDDGADPVSDLVPEDTRVRYVRLGEKMTIGAKRNVACREARGELIAHWDDDDWYAPDRISRQVAALLDSGAEVCGTSTLLFYDAANRRAWEYAYAGRPTWVAGSSLLYRKSFWARHNFPAIRLGEDTRFVWDAPVNAVHDMHDAGLCVALIHGANTGRKDTSGFYWREESCDRVHALLGGDLPFYERETARILPLVSCVMPTYNRRPFIPLALASFARQSYANAELLVVDDGEDSVSDLCEGVPRVRYFRMRRRATIGAKRNFALREARGEVVAHWDDDDWYAPDRLRYQVAPILAGEADLTGLIGDVVMELPGCRFWSVLPGLHASMFVGDVHGGTLAFGRTLVERGIRYPEANLAEDAALLRQALARGLRLSRLANDGRFVYVRHTRNAWGEFVPGNFLDPAGWRRIEPPREVSRETLEAYRAAAAHLA
ncbi:MAG TPA: glycosyltransferase [Pyrinomonadaceae bacterium]|nr:glycosyltransferase [Pyrinomonadaceae bacterium]